MCRSIVYSAIRRLVDTNALAQSLWRTQNANTEYNTHAETTNMGKVVETGEKAKNEGNCNVEEEEKKILDRRAARVPVVEKVEKDEGKDTKKGARGPDRSDALSCVVATENEAKDSCAKIDQGETKTADFSFYVATKCELQKHIEGDMDHSCM